MMFSCYVFSRDYVLLFSADDNVFVVFAMFHTNLLLILKLG